MKIGILGGGQLGRMSILAGRRHGHAFRAFEPSPNSCAAAVADETINAPYTDEDALERFASGLDVVTLEFENIPRRACEVVSAICPLRPGTEVLSIAQHRLREKTWLTANGFACAPFAVADSEEALAEAVEKVGRPCVVKTAAFGYDGKGQVVVGEADDLRGIYEKLGNPAAVVVEGWINHRGEYSIVCARRPQGEISTFAIAENIHKNHILHTTIFPGRVSNALADQASALACRLAEKLALEGVVAVELFLTDDNRWLVNEIAPRPHNSGHATIDACVTDQFEQHIRAVTDVAFGSTRVHTPAVMVNLLGELWQNGPPHFDLLTADPNVKLHLYDKGAARVGRKMGHFTVLDTDVSRGIARAEQLFDALQREA